MMFMSLAVNGCQQMQGTELNSLVAPSTPSAKLKDRPQNSLCFAVFPSI